MRTPTPVGPIVLVISALACWGNASAQLTISEPLPGSPIVRQVSASGSHGIPASKPLSTTGIQILVSVQYLMVDEAARAEIYNSLRPNTIETAAGTMQRSKQPGLELVASRLAASRQTRTPCWTTVCVLEQSEVDNIIELAEESAASEVSRAPNVSLLDGKEAEMRDLVERSFVVNFEWAGKSIQPVVEVLDEGTRLRLLATLVAPVLSPQPRRLTINLTTEIAFSRILDIKSDQIYGLQQDPMTVHVPTHQVVSAVAKRQLIPGQTLMIDPHVSQTRSVSKQTEVPMIGKIPFLGRRFKNTSVADVEQNTLVLLRPSIEKKNSR